MITGSIQFVEVRYKCIRSKLNFSTFNLCFPNYQTSGPTSINDIQTRSALQNRTLNSPLLIDFFLYRAISYSGVAEWLEWRNLVVVLLCMWGTPYKPRELKQYLCVTPSQTLNHFGSKSKDKKKAALLCCLYRPPSTNHRQIHANFNDIEDQIQNIIAWYPSKGIILAGDLNADSETNTVTHSRLCEPEVFY